MQICFLFFVGINFNSDKGPLEKNNKYKNQKKQTKQTKTWPQVL